MQCQRYLCRAYVQEKREPFRKLCSTRILTIGSSFSSHSTNQPVHPPGQWPGSCSRLFHPEHFHCLCCYGMKEGKLNILDFASALCPPYKMTLKNWNWQELSLDCTVSQLVCNTLYWLVSRWMLTAFCLRYTFPVCTFTDLSWTNVKVNFWVAQPYNGWRAKLQDTLWGKKPTNVGKEL